MHNKGFEKETFKETVRENIKTLYRKTIDEATPQQIFQAVSYAVKDVIIDDWIAHRKRMTRQMQRLCITCLWSF